MEIKTLKRPWQKQVKQGNRYNADPFYQSSTWKQIRETHINGSTVMPDGFVLSNKYCVECYPLLVLMHTVDHIHRIKAGGSRDDPNNLQSLCSSHHAKKSAFESNETQHGKTH
jgi:5-methylcytosine-specific restriction endonuclease McrA